MKKSSLLAILLLLSCSAFAWIHADNQATLCNESNTYFHFKKTYSYQANTNNDHSADFKLFPNDCVFIDYWLLYQDSGYDDDDDLEFSTQEAENFSFHIKGLLDREVAGRFLYSIVTQFNMPGFKVSVKQRGKWLFGKQANLEFSIKNAKTDSN